MQGPLLAGRSKEEEEAILDRRVRVAARYRQRIPNYKIAAEEQVDPATITRDLAAIREEWKATAAIPFGERKDEEVAQLDLVQAKAYEAYEKTGKVQYLELVRKCILDRCEIFGILERQSVGISAVVTVVGGIDLQAVLGAKPGIPIQVPLLPNQTNGTNGSH